VIKVKHMETFEDEGGVGDTLEPIYKVVQCKVDLRANTTSSLHTGRSNSALQQHQKSERRVAFERIARPLTFASQWESE